MPDRVEIIFPMKITSKIKRNVQWWTPQKTDFRYIFNLELTSGNWHTPATPSLALSDLSCNIGKVQIDVNTVTVLIFVANYQIIWKIITVHASHQSHGNAMLSLWLFHLYSVLLLVSGGQTQNPSLLCILVNQPIQGRTELGKKSSQIFYNAFILGWQNTLVNWPEIKK